MKILIICTGNTCRSQMAEGFLRKKYPDWDIFSAGTKAETVVNPFAVKVMQEVDISIEEQKPSQIAFFLDQSFDYVFTVCDEANEICPMFSGNVKKRLHIGFEDPAKAVGSEEKILPIYRNVRNQIIEYFDKFRFEH
ncbi:MAG: arsenate reductase ArsC [Bacteroidales bacterium]|nr:arsenate reductase ArsC [Bacteroidales bacterium]